MLCIIAWKHSEKGKYNKNIVFNAERMLELIKKKRKWPFPSKINKWIDK